MNAKKLIEAAKRVMDLSLPGEIVDDTWLCLKHILATVKPDDDETIDWQWAVESVANGSVQLPGWVNVTKRGECVMHSWSALTGTWQVWGTEYQIGTCATRGQFRALCRGLGIELKEVATNKESGNE